MQHETVLLKETIDGLNLKPDPDSVVLDATFGGGGHSMEILRRFPRAKVIALDQDKNAWKKNDLLAQAGKKKTEVIPSSRLMG